MNFNTYSFKELLIDIVDNRGKTCPVEESGMPLIATNCIKENTLYPVFEKVRYVSDDTYKTWFRGHPKSGDMIFVCKGSPGRVNWVPDPVSFCIAQDMVSIRADETKVYPKYLFALLRSKVTQQKILNMHVGSLIPHFKKGDFGNLYFDIPDDMDYQKKVGDAYFDFCLKIEANSQLNQTLEEMAQAIFKSWFVDFDPVKAKMNGEQPEGMDAATASLFPEKLVESELGLIPEGWEVKGLPNGTLFREGPGILAKDFHDKGVPLIRLAGLKNGVSLLDGCNYLDPEKVDKKWKHFLLQEGDILLSSSASLGRVAEVTKQSENSIAYTGIIAFRPIDDVTTRKYLKYFIQSPSFQRQIEAFGVGSVLKHFGPTHLKKMWILLPPVSIQDKFEQLVLALDGKIQTGLEQNQSLSNLRDTLLPKLLSGEIELDKVLDV
ncbi:restriction endonuclease subunit S [Vibrio splendidus]